MFPCNVLFVILSKLPGDVKCKCVYMCECVRGYDKWLYRSEAICIAYEFIPVYIIDMMLPLNLGRTSEKISMLEFS